MHRGRLLNAEDDVNVETAAGVIRDGGLVAFPTETVYGLGADATNVKAVCRVFEAKKRPSFDPLIVHVADPDQAARLWKNPPKLAETLMKNFWPGPLTLVLPKSSLIPDVVTAGLPTVAVRVPKHPVALKLIQKSGRPIAAPSANLFGYTSATSAIPILEELGNSVDVILDGGPSKLGIESTVIRIEEDRCVLLRPGGVSVEEIEEFARVERAAPAVSDGPMVSPGLLKSHYAPWTPMTLMDASSGDFMKELHQAHKYYLEKELIWPRVGLLLYHKKTGDHWVECEEVLSPGKDPYEAASNLFKAIRKLDKMNLDLIIAEVVPETGIGLAIMDRLKKAASGRAGLKDFLKKQTGH
jgi:L-threonylcarbamoyladenylate synthase